MRKITLTTATLLGLAAVPALAYETSSTTQIPPSVNANEAVVQPDNSLPPAADTSTYDRAGNHLGEEGVPPAVARLGPGRDAAAPGRLIR